MIDPVLPMKMNNPKPPNLYIIRLNTSVQIVSRRMEEKIKKGQQQCIKEEVITRIIK